MEKGKIILANNLETEIPKPSMNDLKGSKNPLSESNCIDGFFVQICDYLGKSISESFITIEDIRKSWEQWPLNDTNGKQNV